MPRRGRRRLERTERRQQLGDGRVVLGAPPVQEIRRLARIGGAAVRCADRR